MSTKSLQVFDGKIRILKQHLQLADLALTMANKECNRMKGNGKRINETLYAKHGTHNQLNHPNESIDIRRTFITSRNKLNEQAIVDLYSVFSLYISDLVEEMSKKNPRKILSLMNDKNEAVINFPDLIKLGSYDAILSEMSRRIYRSLESERSTPKLLKRFIKFTKIQICQNLLDEALLYLEVRHLIIHNASKADAKFKSMNSSSLVNLKNKDRIDTCYDLSNTSINKVYELCHRIDNELQRLGLL